MHVANIPLNLLSKQKLCDGKCDAVTCFKVVFTTLSFLVSLRKTKVYAQLPGPHFFDGSLN